MELLSERTTLMCACRKWKESRQYEQRNQVIKARQVIRCRLGLLVPGWTKALRAPALGHCVAVVCRAVHAQPLWAACVTVWVTRCCWLLGLQALEDTWDSSDSSDDVK